MRAGIHRPSARGPGFRVVGRIKIVLYLDRTCRVFGLAQDPDGGPTFLLASLPSNDPTQIRSVLLRITGHRPAAPRLAPAPTTYRYDVVNQTARGEREDYALEPRPLAPLGGQGAKWSRPRTN